MNLIKKIFTIFVILGFFVALLAISQTINPQPVSAASCSLIFATSGPPIVGKSITATIKDTIPGGSYGVDLRRIGFGSVDNQHKTATGSSLSFTIDGSKITVAGDYQFESLRTDIVENCIDPPVFTVDVGMADCILKSKDMGGNVGEPVSFWLTDIEVGNTYIVELYTNGHVLDSIQLTVPPGMTTWIDSFPGSDFQDASATYQLKALQLSPFRARCANPSEFRLSLAGKNPCEGGICNTALGPIKADIGEFAEKILAIGIGLAGGIALIIMVIGSVRVLTSAGDPKNVAAGREMIIAAVAGLLFLIFSVIILKFIGIYVVDLI